MTTIEANRQPEGDRYQKTFRAYGQDKISAVAFPEVTFLARDLIR